MRNFRKFTPFMCAVYNGHLECVKELFELKRVYDVDIKERNIFHLCACQNNIECFRYLIKQIPNQSDVIKILFKRDKSGNTILHNAAHNGHFEFIASILKEFTGNLICVYLKFIDICTFFQYFHNLHKKFYKL